MGKESQFPPIQLILPGLGRPEIPKSSAHKGLLYFSPLKFKCHLNVSKMKRKQLRGFAPLRFYGLYSIQVKSFNRVKEFN